MGQPRTGAWRVRRAREIRTAWVRVRGAGACSGEALSKGGVCVRACVLVRVIVCACVCERGRESACARASRGRACLAGTRPARRSSRSRSSTLILPAPAHAAHAPSPAPTRAPHRTAPRPHRTQPRARTHNARRPPAAFVTGRALPTGAPERRAGRTGVRAAGALPCAAAAVRRRCAGRSRTALPCVRRRFPLRVRARVRVRFCDDSLGPAQRFSDCATACGARTRARPCAPRVCVCPWARR